MALENKTSIPWVEKYRPSRFEDIVLDDINRKIFENIIKNEHFPNLLFYGPPGTGKTTTIINLIRAYQEKINNANFQPSLLGSGAYIKQPDNKFDFCSWDMWRHCGLAKNRRIACPCLLADLVG